MKRKLLFIDTETGGLDPKVNAIMSVAAVVVHEGFIDDTYYTLVKDPTGVIEPEARAVNKISDEDIALLGKSPGQVVEDIEQMLLRHDMRLPRRVVIGGHNTRFDEGFLRRVWSLASTDYDMRFERRYIDTMAAGYCLEQAGRIETYGPPSLENLCRALHVSLDRSGAHNAVDDAIAAAKIWAKMVGMMRHSERMA